MSSTVAINSGSRIDTFTPRHTDEEPTRPTAAQLYSNLISAELRESSRLIHLHATLRQALPDTPHNNFGHVKAAVISANATAARENIENAIIGSTRFSTAYPPFAATPDLSAEERSSLIADRHTQAAAEWRQWLSVSHGVDEHVRARKGEGPGGEIYRAYASSRQWLATITDSLLQDREHGLTPEQHRILDLSQQPPPMEGADEHKVAARLAGTEDLATTQLQTWTQAILTDAPAAYANASLKTEFASTNALLSGLEMCMRLPAPTPPPITPTPGATPQERLQTFVTRHAQAAAAWKTFRDSEHFLTVADARNGEGPGALLYKHFRDEREHADIAGAAVLANYKYSLTPPAPAPIAPLVRTEHPAAPSPMPLTPRQQAILGRMHTLLHAPATLPRWATIMAAEPELDKLEDFERAATAASLKDPAFRSISATLRDRRVDFERAYYDLLGALPLVHKDPPPSQALTLDHIKALASKHFAAAEGWSDWYDYASLSQITAARTGQGPAAELCHEFRSTRAWLHDATLSLNQAQTLPQSQARSSSPQLPQGDILSRVQALTNSPNHLSRGQTLIAAERTMTKLENQEQTALATYLESFNSETHLSPSPEEVTRARRGQRIELEDAYYELLGPPPLPDKQQPAAHGLTAADRVEVFSKRHTKVAAAWAEWRDHASLRDIWQARVGKGPGADLCHEFRSTRAWVYDATLEMRHARAQEQAHSRSI